MVTLAWPKQGDVAFSESGIGESFYLDPHPIYPTHPAAFKSAADLLIDARLADRKLRYHYGDLFYPVAYLYRHALELLMKEFLRAAAWRGYIEKDEIAKAVKEHYLEPLWHLSEKTLDAIWPDGDRECVEAAEAVILEFDTHDRDGQQFRYDRNRGGKRVKRGLPTYIKMKTLRQTVDGIYNLLDINLSLLLDDHGP